MSEAPDGSYVNPRGIPQAPFITDVEKYVGSADRVEEVLRQFQDTIQKYRYMESTTGERSAGLAHKIPEIQRTLDMVEFLHESAGEGKHELALYELNDTLYAKARVAPSESVYLWLGANVMLEFSIDEARQLLSDKLNAAHRNLDTCTSDLEFLRENITTMEVNTARVYNWQVQCRQAQA